MDDILDDGREFQMDSSDDYALIINLKREFHEVEKKVNNGKTVVWILIVLTILNALKDLALGGLGEAVLIVLGIYVFVLAVYIGAIANMEKKPKLSLTIVLIVYVVLQLFSLVALIDVPILMIFSLLLKGIIIYFLAVGVSGAGKYEEIKERLNNLGANT